MSQRKGVSGTFSPFQDGERDKELILLSGRELHYFPIKQHGGGQVMIRSTPAWTYKGGGLRGPWHRTPWQFCLRPGQRSTGKRYSMFTDVNIEQKLLSAENSGFSHGFQKLLLVASDGTVRLWPSFVCPRQLMPMAGGWVLAVPWELHVGLSSWWPLCMASWVCLHRTIRF